MKIALVANGESALKTKVGKIIDECEIVVRMGNYQTRGYEEYVGTKTTIHGTAKWKYIQKSSEASVWFVDEFNSDYNNDLIKKLNYNKDKITQNTTFDIHRPTIGTRILHRVVSDFVGATLYVKGFDFLTTGYYFDNKHTYTNCSHPIFLEKCFYNKLVVNKIIYEI